MALSIKSDEADALARELARLTGESLTDAVIESLRERLDRERRVRGDSVAAVIARAQARMRELPRRPGATWSTDDLYDDDGLPA